MASPWIYPDLFSCRCLCCRCCLYRSRSSLCLLGAAATGALLGLLLLRSGSESCLVEINELDKGHLGAVTLPETGVEDTEVSTRTVSYLWSHCAEELSNYVLVLEITEDYTTGVCGVILGLGDKRLNVSLEGLGLGYGGIDSLVEDQ